MSKPTGNYTDREIRKKSIAVDHDDSTDDEKVTTGVRDYDLVTALKKFARKQEDGNPENLKIPFALHAFGRGIYFSEPVGAIYEVSGGLKETHLATAEKVKRGDPRKTLPESNRRFPLKGHFKDEIDFISNKRLADRSLKRHGKNKHEEAKARNLSQKIDWAFADGSAKEEMGVTANNNVYLSGKYPGYRSDWIDSENQSRPPYLPEAGKESVVDIANYLKTKEGLTDQQIAAHVRQTLKGDQSGLSEEGKKRLVFLTSLLFGPETSRNPAGYVTHQMFLDLIEGGYSGFETWEGSLRANKLPMMIGGAIAASRKINDLMNDDGLMPVSYHYDYNIGHQSNYRHSTQSPAEQSERDAKTILANEETIAREWLRLNGRPETFESLAKFLPEKIAEWYRGIDLSHFSSSIPSVKKGELREVNDVIDEKDGEAENLRKEIDALKAKLELVLKINDLSQRIEYGEIYGQDEIDEIEDLYERATENDLFEETENSSYDPNSKFEFLLEISNSEESLEKQKGSAESNLDDLEGELEKLYEKQKILEQQIKDLSSVVPSKKSAGTNVTKKSTQKVSTVADHEEDDLDIFNYVGESSNLTHQNVLHLIGEAFELSGIDSSQTTVAVISEDDSLDHCLRDEILKFIGKDSAQDRISIALCRGHIDAETGQIEGNTHWTALHLRIIENEDGTISIKPYYMDSMGGVTPKTVTRVLDSIKETTLEDLGADLAANVIYQRAIERLEDVNFEECQVVECAQQQDGYSCGYHAVFNMLRIHYSDEIDKLPEAVTQGDVEVEVDQFIEDRKSDLQTHFNPMINDQLQQHARFGADMYLNRALSESILDSDDSDLDRLKKLIELEKEIKESEKDPAIVLSFINLEKFYKKLLSQCVEQIRYKFLTTKEYEVGGEDDVQKREQILEKLSSSKTAQNPQEFLEILERIVADPTLLSSSLDALLEDIGEVEKEQSPEDSLIKSMAKASLETKSPSSSIAKAKTKQLAASGEVTKKITRK